MHEIALAFDKMMDEVKQLNTEKGWRTGNTTFGEYIALLHSEVSETLESYRDHKLDDATEIVYGKHIPKPEGVGAELADVLIRILDMCDIYDIDLAFEYDRKMRYGWTRNYQHGGRTL
jgi:NTP pyrophosphatase (non-canonical NTP hydrolase)